MTQTTHDFGNKLQSAQEHASREQSPQTQSFHPKLSETESVRLSSTLSRIQVIKRNHQAVTFDASKIALAMTKAMLAVEGDSASGSARVRELVTQITQDIAQRFARQLPDGGTVNIEDIQDQVELGLMRKGLQKVARAYVLYREQHAQNRAAELNKKEFYKKSQNKKDRYETDQDKTAHDSETEYETLKVLLDDGSETSLSMKSIKLRLVEACEGFSDVSSELIFTQVTNNLFSGMKLSDVDTALTMTVRPMIEQEPNYSYVCAQLLNQTLKQEVAGVLALDHSSDNLYLEAFTAFIHQGVEKQLLDQKLLSFDLNELALALKPERDRQFTYLGLQTLYDRYFIHHQQSRMELPQVFFMRVAMGLALKEDNPTKRAIEFYNVLSSFDYMCSTPTLFNAATQRSQLSSCYLTTVDDDLSSIYQSVADNAQLSKWAGGLGNDWTPVRSLGAHIKGTNGESQGVIPFLKVVNDTAVAVNQGGKRKGAVCAYLETWHLDIEDFLELRKNTGDERRRTHDMNSANWIPDLFMKRVFNDEQWTLFSPSDVPDLHDLYGDAFEKRYQAYEAMVDRKEITLYRRLPAKQLWQKMLSMLFETGHPWITFKDPCNIRSPQQHQGVVHSSNLCTEITLNTNAEEIAVCNLGSINLPQHMEGGELDHAHLQATIQTAVRMLDNVVDINFYPVEKARQSNMKHRPIGLGLMGFQDALYLKQVPYASIEAVQFADQSMELISYFALEASSALAEERGCYPSFEGSLWQKGLLPIDSLEHLQTQRGEEYCTFDTVSSLDWSSLREKIKRYGMRNSNVLAIAPTATIANIVGVSQSIEPMYQNLYVKSNLSGEFTVLNHALVNSLKQQDLWDSVMINDLKYFDGSLQPIERIPDAIKAVYATAFEIDSRWLIEAASRRQKWIDQAQSLNLYMAEASGKKLDNLYKLAWSRGLKTTYYLRSLGATQAEKLTEHSSNNHFEINNPSNNNQAQVFTGKIQTENAQSVTESAVCSILEPDCEACQ